MLTIIKPITPTVYHANFLMNTTQLRPDLSNPLKHTTNYKVDSISCDIVKSPQLLHIYTWYVLKSDASTQFLLVICFVMQQKLFYIIQTTDKTILYMMSDTSRLKSFTNGENHLGNN